MRGHCVDRLQRWWWVESGGSSCRDLRRCWIYFEMKRMMVMRTGKLCMLKWLVRAYQSEEGLLCMVLAAILSKYR